jgi:N,N'-diacetyllegionaminate synthase
LALGNGSPGMTAGESDVRRLARRSLVARQGIARGTRITRAMLCVKRPGTGIAPGRINEVVGREAAVEIPQDTLLSWAMVR